MSFIVEVKGPGHHERSEFAGSVVKVLSESGRVVAVEADLRPRLAKDLSEMLQVGAREVLLYAEGMLAKVVLGPQVAVRSDLEPLHDQDIEVIVRLVPGDEPVRAVIDSSQDKALAQAVLEMLSDKGITAEST